jgi:hypothetical protein
MHILYLDDSGSPTNRNEEYFVLGGVSVPETSVRWLNYELEKIAADYNEDPSSVELHAAEIFKGSEHPWKEMTNKGDRVKVIKRVLSSLDTAKKDIVLFACAVHKASVTKEDAVIHAYEEISSRFNRYLQRISDETKQKQRGIIVLDKSSYETGLQNLTSQFRKTGNRWGGYMKEIVEVPLFVDSKASRIVQLADHIAYAVFRRYNSDDLGYMKLVENRFDEMDGKICGLSHKIVTHKTCTCPACLSRR